MQLNELQKAFIQQIKLLHQKIRAPISAPDAVVYTPEILVELAKGVFVSCFLFFVFDF